MEMQTNYVMYAYCNNFGVFFTATSVCNIFLTNIYEDGLQTLPPLSYFLSKENCLQTAPCSHVIPALHHNTLVPTTLHNFGSVTVEWKAARTSGLNNMPLLSSQLQKKFLPLTFIPACRHYIWTSVLM